ncbi:MAG: hypothetical protein IIA88_07730 [Bacteroidetes bacterium]|nr:hypothetical protein [Bacteroidota bacterium]
MPGRNFSTPSYRFGFNGMESDDEIKGNKNSYDFGARIYFAIILKLKQMINQNILWKIKKGRRFRIDTTKSKPVKDGSTTFMFKLLSYLFLIFIICKCNFSPLKEHIEYYENGNIKSVFYKRKGKKVGVETQYFKNGNIDVIYGWYDGLQNGKVIDFDTNGNILLEGHFLLGMQHGLYKIYENSTLKMLQEYENDTLTKQITYDSAGNMLSSNCIIEVIPEKDTIDYGQLYKFQIKFQNHFFDYMSVIFGQLDEENNLIDTIDILNSDKYIIDYEIMPKTKGENKFTAIVRDVKKESDYTVFHSFFLEHKYYVK